MLNGLEEPNCPEEPEVASMRTIDEEKESLRDQLTALLPD